MEFSKTKEPPFFGGGGGTLVTPAHIIPEKHHSEPSDASKPPKMVSKATQVWHRNSEEETEDHFVTRGGPFVENGGVEAHWLEGFPRFFSTIFFCRP